MEKLTPTDLAKDEEERKIIEEVAVLRTMINRLLPECYFCNKEINYRAAAMWQQDEIIGNDHVIFVCQKCHFEQKHKMGSRHFDKRIRAITNFTASTPRGPKKKRGEKENEKENEMDPSKGRLKGEDVSEP